MSERFRERLGILSEELDGKLRSVSPSGSRSPRRMSRSPRPHGSTSSTSANEPAIGITRPLIRQSHPEIAAWPAPPPAHQLSGNVRTPTVGPTPPSPTLAVRHQPPPQVSPSPISPSSQHSPASSRYELDNSSSLLSVLKFAASTRENNVSRHNSRMNLESNLLTNCADILVSAQPAGRETELKRKIQTLEDTVAEYERQKYNVMGTFSEYRERVAERERKLEAEYSGKIIALSEEVLGAKKDFEARMKSFQALQDKFEREKEQALEKLRKEHQKEIQVLEQRFSDTQLLNLEQKYILEIQRLEEERKSLRAEKERLGETFEMKLRRAQSLYETELTAAKMLYTKELEALRDHEEALKEELLARQDEFHDRLQELQLQSKRSREELVSCKNEVTALEKKLQNKEKEVQAITKELDEARTETNDSIRRLSAVTAEFSECKQKFREQEEELNRKTRLLNVVEAAKEKLESVISDLQIEVRALKNKVEFLEKERDNLQSQSESQTQLQSSQVNALEAVLDSVTKEKESTKEHYESLLLKERQQAEAREHAMKKEFSSKLNELEEQYTSLKEELEESARLDKDELRESTQIEIQALRTEKSILAAEIRVLTQKIEDEEQDEMTEQLAKIVEDTSHLTRTLEEYRERICGKDAEISSLRKQLEQEMLSTENRNKLMKEAALKDSIEKDEENEAKLKEIRDEIDEMKREFNHEKDISNERLQKVKDLEDQNKILLEKLENATSDTNNTEKLQSELDAKNIRIEELENKISELVTAESSKKFDLEETIAKLENDNSAKTDQLEKLHIKVNEMLEQVGNIKQQLDKKNKEIKQITAKNSQSETNKSEAEVKLATILEEQESDRKHFEEILRAKETAVIEKSQLIENLENDLKNKEDDLIEMKEKLEELTQQLNEETTVVLFDNSIQEQIKEKESTILEMTETMDLKDQKIQKLEEELENNARQEFEDEELKDRIDELENALERKNELIQQLQEKLADEPIPENQTRKRSSLTSHGVFQNFVSQMKDKREEASERSKKKEAEKKAAKEAAKDREKSPSRAKSPSLLTRLRDRSPAKSKSPNLETTPSTSSRNLLSPSDAEKRMERSSPSRPLFSRNKAKESSTSSTSADKPRPAWKF
ncbi:unnamed protein product [Caenorhabditis angaria]|uniref:Protein FAM184A/B N-terminal domain-containing protein n=1 Tax=Caenorhabditis angaria TaxID=860376 RepID=A0A9P1N8T3_9PELO|nr:unnamed protein product [Caenorhabditis angaria]